MGDSLNQILWCTFPQNVNFKNHEVGSKGSCKRHSQSKTIPGLHGWDSGFRLLCAGSLLRGGRFLFGDVQFWTSDLETGANR
jgi:hypothetical protein